MKTDAYVFSNIGNREINEDYACYVLDEEGVLAVACDGLGGHDKGEVASKTIAESIKENFAFDQLRSDDSEESVKNYISNIINKAQDAELFKCNKCKDQGL